MEAPEWVAPALSWLTAVVLLMVLQVNILKEAQKRQKEPRDPRPPLRSWALVAYLVKSVAADLRRFVVLLWAATVHAANFASRIGVLVATVVLVIFGFRLPASVPGWRWLWGLPFALAGAGVCRLIARRIADKQLKGEATDERS